MSWTVSFLRRWRPVLTWPSLLRYRSCMIRVERGQIRAVPLHLTLKPPFRASISLREDGSDLLTFEEVFGREVYREACRAAGPCRTIVDLGANIGLASIYLAAANPGATLFAVEASPENWEFLQRNLASHLRAGRTSTALAAVWKSDRDLSLNAGAPGRYNAFTVSESPGEHCVGSIPGRTLPSLLDSAGIVTVDLLKMDIEGAEAVLFEGADLWLPRVRTLAVEFHGGSREASGFDRLMATHRFDIVHEGEHTVVARVRET